MFRDLSLQLKLPIYLSAVLATVILLLSVVAYQEVRTAQVRAAAERLQRVSQQWANLTDLSFTARISEVQRLAGDSAVATVTAGRGDERTLTAARSALAEAMSRSGVVAVEARDPEGVRVLGIGDEGALPVPDLEGVSDPVIGPIMDVDGRIVYSISTQSGEGLGSVSVWRSLDVDSAGQRVIRDLIGFDASLLYGSLDGGWTDLLRGPVPAPPIDPSTSPTVYDEPHWYVRHDVGRAYAVVRSVGRAPWHIIVDMPEENVLAGAHRFLLRLLVLAPIALLIVATSAWYLGRAITRSLRETAAAAEAIAAGESGHRVEVRGTDEVGRLATSFNTMAQRVEDSKLALEKLNASLAGSNAELENFAYVASHDLREPLRMVRSFTQLLADRYAGQLDADADKYIHFAVDGATRMEGLVKGLLDYSRLDGAKLRATCTSSRESLELALQLMAPTLEEAAASVSHDPLPDVMVDPDHLLRVFQNLIGNAVKFRGEDDPWVHVSARPEGDYWVFSVRDNGIGIESRYFERVFEIFKRLHGQKEFAGTGMGLSISKKIVERHGGRMWLESTPGEGTTFYFTLPASAAMVA